MQPANLSRVRVLIVGARGYAAALLRTVLNANGVMRVCITEDARRALEQLCSESFDAVFLEEMVELEGKPFAMAARRTPSLQNPMIPIFMLHSGARRRDVEKSRDLGVNCVIIRPFSPRTIMEKLATVLTAPRPFIAAPQFFGPDRRSKTREATPPFREDRRVRTPHKAKLSVFEI